MPAYLLDTNALIYFFNGEEKISKLIDNSENFISISFISKIELLCFEIDDDNIMDEINSFISETNIILIDDEIISKAIDYRKNLKLKIPDAIIAATAKVKGLILVTADKSLIKKLKDIETIKPI